jgi:hypothetical protein
LTPITSSQFDGFGQGQRKALVGAVVQTVN